MQDIMYELKSRVRIELQHKTLEHPKSAKTEQSNFKYFCGQIFSSKSPLKKHIWRTL